MFRTALMAPVRLSRILIAPVPHPAARSVDSRAFIRTWSPGSPGFSVQGTSLVLGRYVLGRPCEAWGTSRAGRVLWGTPRQSRSSGIATAACIPTLVCTVRCTRSDMQNPSYTYAALPIYRHVRCPRPPSSGSTNGRWKNMLRAIGDALVHQPSAPCNVSDLNPEAKRKKSARRGATSLSISAGGGGEGTP
ncbi:uncharacterized protein C8Q71DRAFT_777007 [Rhodofomes roseus]|uniref:Uncharacterized protein n=1 Tax=Rhodofomes roseus TaxID=34475 RepID=A0ABQ8K640_9APHY|nr:uncharacterized protein C8Q71DRAFT_777007 [Rhodofomes roseus]KAH9832553.1 hypothetical protein C8Q71DRAFT_777007 [Rhodofomes roseus]